MNKKANNRRVFLKKSMVVTSAVISAGIIPESILAKQKKEVSKNLQEMVKNIFWIEQAAVKINTGSKVIYFDPFKIKNEDKADIVFISHSHQHHLSLSDISKVATENTVFIAPDDCLTKIKEKFIRNESISAKPGIKQNIHDIGFETVPAYNIKKTKYHPKNNKWVGYIITINNIRIYHAGDTERIPEMKEFTCDIAMVPLGQTFTMNSVEDAVQSVKDVQAKIAIPIHFGLYEGTVEDSKKFEKLLRKDIHAIIKTKT
jgi:L-ascorbate metabolism protein UlaG (beta-lactamase superfamily)